MSKISELSDGGSLVSTDFLIAVRSGGNVKVQMDTINVDQVDLGDNEFIRLGNSQDLTLVHTPTQSIINQAGVGDLLIQKAGTTKASITANGLEFPDSSKAIFGAGSDATLHSDGSAGYARGFVLQNIAGNKDVLSFVDGGAATLFHDNAAKLATAATGIAVTGTATATSFATAAGGTFTTAAGNDLNIVYPDGRSLFFKESGTTTLALDNTQGATFAGDVLLGDSNVLRFGADQDLRISFDGSHGIIQNVTGDSDIIFKGKDGTSPINALILDMSENGAAAFSGTIASSVITAKSSGNTDSALIVQQTGSTDGWGLIPNNVNGNLEITRIGGGTAGTHVTVDNAGKVGIGCSPAAPLNVARSGDGTIVRLLSIGLGEWDFSMGNSSTLTGVGAGALELLPLNAGTGSEFAIGQAGSSTPVLHVKSGDVYLSGGAYLGGTAAANKLDDYEEGTFTPTSGVALTVTQFTYTKIGRMVHIIADISFAASTSGSIAVVSLPFAGVVNSYNTGSINYTTYTTDTASVTLEPNGLMFRTNQTGSTLSYAAVASKRFICDATYFTTL